MVFYMLVAVVFAVVGYTNVYSENSPDEVMKNYENLEFDTKEPSYYNDLRKDMDEWVDMAQDWVGFNMPKKNYVNETTEYLGDEDNCGTTTEIMKPYVIKVKNDATTTTYNVVQSSFFEQSFEVTICRTPSTPCMTSVFGIENYECKTKMGTISLYTYEYDDTDIIGKKKIKNFAYVDVDVPVCCACESNNSMYKK